MNISFKSSVLAIGVIILASCKTISSSTTNKSTTAEFTPKKPKLVVGIVVDQMRYDYIYKFQNKFGENGFKKLISNGFFCENTNFNYVPTYTAPGHTSIYTGSTPKTHGIVGNDFYLRSENKMVYCTADESVNTVGADNTAGKMSPHRNLATTITDEIKLASNFRSKVIGISLKDRGAILPAGHLADAAYWYDTKSGNWITSTFYRNELPNWLTNYNAKQIGDSLANLTWNTFYPIEQYTECQPDNSPYEKIFKGKTSPTFPYNLKELRKENRGIDIVKYTPFGNTLLKEMAIKTLKEEELGKHDFVDMLTVSFSSTDYAGHTYGPESIELADTYVRLDRDLAELITALENQVGKDNLLLFLTADHGGANVAAYLEDRKVSAGYFDKNEPIKELNTYLETTYGVKDLVIDYSNQQLFLDHKKITDKKIVLREIRERSADFLFKYDGVAKTMTADVLNENEFKKGVEYYVQMGYNAKRSGDVAVIYNPGFVDWYGPSGKKGTTHGSGYSYDTHVPLIWYGGNIRQGNSFVPVEIVDIAPTVASFLKINFPSGNVGKPIHWIQK